MKRPASWNVCELDVESAFGETKRTHFVYALDFGQRIRRSSALPNDKAYSCEALTCVPS